MDKNLQALERIIKLSRSTLNFIKQQSIVFRYFLIEKQDVSLYNKTNYLKNA